MTEGDGITTIELLFASLTHANLIADAVPGVPTARESATQMGEYAFRHQRQKCQTMMTAMFPIPEAVHAPLDLDLRDRVNDAAAEFDRSFAAAAAQPSRHNLDKLCEATDRLVRAGARVLIELNRT